MALPALVFAFLAPALYGAANILDNFLVGKLFRKIPALIFYSELLNVLFIPFVWLFQTPELPSWNVVPIFLAIGACDMLYLYPYYKALQSDDTAVVSSLFSIGKIFVPILAFLIVGEVLTMAQYLGFALIITSSTLLTLSVKHGSLRLRPSFFYMLIASLLISLEIVLYKYLLENVSWSTGFVSSLLAAFGLAFLMLLVRRWRKDIMEGWSIFRRRFPLLAAEELLTVGATGSYTYATASLPATLIGGIAESQSFIVLLYAVLFSRFFPKVFKEKIDTRNVFKKISLFVLTIIGVALILS